MSKKQPDFADSHRIEFKRHAEALDDMAQPLNLNVLQDNMRIRRTADPFFRKRIIDDLDPPPAYDLEVVVQGGRGGNGHDDVSIERPILEGVGDRATSHFTAGHD